METIDGILPFVLYFVAGVSSLAIFLRVYLWLTPYDDMALIRSGNTSAAIALAGAMLGYSIPLARSIEQAYGPIDFGVWSLVALCAQTAVFLLVRKLFSNFVQQVKEDRMGEAIVLAALSIAVGMISAAAMTD